MQFLEAQDFLDQLMKAEKYMSFCGFTFIATNRIKKIIVSTTYIGSFPFASACSAAAAAAAAASTAFFSGVPSDCSGGI